MKSKVIIKRNWIPCWTRSEKVQYASTCFQTCHASFYNTSEIEFPALFFLETSIPRVPGKMLKKVRGRGRKTKKCFEENNGILLGTTLYSKLGIGTKYKIMKRWREKEIGNLGFDHRHEKCGFSSSPKKQQNPSLYFKIQYSETI